MKIAMVGQRGIPANYGGIDTAVEELASRLAKRGHQVTVFCRANLYPQKEKEFKGVTLKYFPSINTKALDTLSHGLVCSVYASLRDYDLVHFHGLASALWSILPRICFKKSILTIQGLDWKAKKWDSLAKLFLRFLEGVSARFPNQTVVVSNTLVQYYQRRYRRKISYIPNGAQIRSDFCFRGVFRSNEQAPILYLGRLVPQKGIHYLIEVFKKINTDKRLVITGSSSHSDKYVRHLRDLAKPDKRIIFTGPLYGPQKEEILQRAYLFVLPSEIEGLSLSLLEAMGRGMCCLVSDIPENLEAIAEAGFSFRTNDLRDLKEKLKFLLANPDLVKKTGQSARLRVERYYNWEQIVDTWEGLYSLSS